MGVATREGTAQDAIAGVQPRLVLEPDSAEAIAEAVEDCARDRLRFAAVGGGTALGLGAPPTGLDAVIRTRRAARILEYQPADMVLVCEAGVTLAEIAAETAKNRQQLALDAPLPARATLGGVIAANSFGPRRAKYGAIRDLILGATLVRPDGVPARSGGKVVKNVAGFDLPKVACGSLGTLAVIASAAVRLHPLPEASATVLARGLPATDVHPVVLRVRAAQLEPAGTLALRAAGGGWDLAFLFEGFAKGVQHQVERLRSTVGSDVLSEADAAAFWARHDRARTAGPFRAKLAWLPSRIATLEPVIATLVSALRDGTAIWDAVLGLGFVAGAVGDPAAVVSALQRARTVVAEGGGSVVLEETPPELRGAVDPWGPRPPAFAQLERLKTNFDPERRLNPGRYVGGL